MSIEKNLLYILLHCKCGVYLTANEHRDYYEAAKDYLDERANGECEPNWSDEVYEEMIKRDTIINLQFYPSTPIGSYDLYHYDLDTILQEATVLLREETNEPLRQDLGTYDIDTTPEEIKQLRKDG